MRASLARLGAVLLLAFPVACSTPRPTADSDADLERSRRAHLDDCLAGARCKLAALTRDERLRVEAAIARLNLEACLQGRGACDAGRLTESQRHEVRAAADARNFEFCRSGLAGCDRAFLTPAQQADVRRAYEERNFRGCMNAVGTLLPCVYEDLDPEQQVAVRRRNEALNFWICRTGAFGCRADLLSDEQRAAIGLPEPSSR